MRHLAPRAGCVALCAALLLSCGKNNAPAPPSGPPAPITEYKKLSAPVEIVTDELGVPHVYAKNDLDLFYTSGYLQGRDRLFALDIFRRQAMGRYAEVFGESGASADIQALALGFPKRGGHVVEALAAEQPEDHNLLIAFTEGLNRRVAEVRAGQGEVPPEYAALGFEPEPFTPQELMAIGVRIQFGYSSTLEFKLLNSFYTKLNPAVAAASNVMVPGSDTFVMSQGPEVISKAEGEVAQRGDKREGGGDEALAQVSAEELRRFFDGLSEYRRALDVGEGSNGWTVNGAHTFNGKPMLANDSHGGLDDPNTLYMMHLNSRDAGGRFDVIGLAFLGVPGIQLGHNRKLAWGATTHFADQMDLWSVDVAAGVATIGDQKIPVTETPLSYKVRKDDGTFETREIKAREVEGYGVLLPGELLPVPKALLLGSGRELLINWPGFQIKLAELSMFLGLDRAESLAEFKQAVQLQRTGMQNWHGITAEGMLYVTSGIVPDRGPVGARPQVNVILDGNDASTFWTGEVLSPERMAQLDGSQPFIVSANNDPWGHTKDNDPLNDGFYYGSFYAPGFRAGRLTEQLNAQVASGQKITREATYTLQHDVHSVLADRTLPTLASALVALDTDATLAEWDRQDIRDAAAQLAAWDRQMLATSRDAALFRVWLTFLSRRVLRDDVGLLYAPIDDAQPITLLKMLIHAIDRDTQELIDGDIHAHALGALSDALALLTERGNPTWGELHVARFSRWDRGETKISTGGGDASINVAQSRCWSGDTFLPQCQSSVGAVFRNVFTIRDDGTPECWFNWPQGNTASTDDWLSNTYKMWRFTRADVEAGEKQRVVLAP